MRINYKSTYCIINPKRKKLRHQGVRIDTMKVICTEKSQILATSLARALKTSVVEVKYSRFPDGEQYLITGELDDETIIVGSVVDNDSLVQLILLMDACDSSDNHLVLPYMGYARQDKRFLPGRTCQCTSRCTGAQQRDFGNYYRQYP